jgi:3'-5' exoribonuclease
MSSTAALDLPSLTPGDRIQGELLVVDRSERTKASGDPFLILTLGNATGQIETAPIWMERLSWADGAERGTIVQAIGDVAVYGRNGASKRQLSLTAPLRVLPKDQFDIHQFLPSIGDCTKLWDWIDKQRAEIKSETLRKVVDLFFTDDDFRLRFERTPGSPSGGHHCTIGGLLLHVYEVTSIAKHTARTMRANVDLTITGSLLHDIGKVEAYSIGPTGFSVTPCGQLLGHITLGALMLERALAKLDHPICTDAQLLELQHMILSHHGSLEFGSPVQPMTLEAEILHWADESSAKANDMAESLDDPDSFASGNEISDKRPWRVGRRIWKRPFTWE